MLYAQRIIQIQRYLSPTVSPSLSREARTKLQNTTRTSIMKMATNQNTVFVTVTDYITVYPTAAPSVTNVEAFPSIQSSVPNLESFPFVTLTQTPIEPTSISFTLLASTFKTSVRSSLSSSTLTTISSLSSSSSLQDSTSLSTRSSQSSIATSLLTRTSQVSSATSFSTRTSQSSSAISTASTESSTPTAPPTNYVEKHPNNAVPILMLVFLVLVAFFLCGALLYFAYGYLRGKCRECQAKTAEIRRLQRCLRPGMIREGVCPMQMNSHKTEDSNVNTISLEPGEEITIPRAVYERGVRILDAEKKTGSQPSSDAKSDPFIYDRAPLPRVSTASTDSLHWRTLSEEQNRAQALHDMTRPHPETLDQSFEEVRLPFWKRTIGRAGVTNYGRPAGVRRPVDQDFAGRDKTPGTGLRTVSNPGSAPAPPTAPTAVHYAGEPKPYGYRSSTGSADARPIRPASSVYSQPGLEDSSEEYITIVLAPPSPRTAALEEAEQARLMELRSQRRKWRTNDYGVLSPYYDTR